MVVNFRYRIIYNKENASYNVYDEDGNYVTSSNSLCDVEWYLREEQTEPVKNVAHTEEWCLDGSIPTEYDNSMNIDGSFCTKCKQPTNNTPSVVYKYHGTARVICVDCQAEALDKMYGLEIDAKLEKVLYKK